jgi:ribulose-5-phosphate 4-epimerase/fuculose-1-phosphate aldolase
MLAMNVISPKRMTVPESAERQARIDLAAAHRLAVHQGFSEGIFNHLTLAVPGTNDRYFQIPLLIAGSGEIERSAFCIHAPIHRLKPRLACVFHTHMPHASALTRLEEPEILPIGQTEIGFLNEVAYDRDYTGLAYDPAEGERLAGVLGDKSILFMANHGVLVCGETVAKAYDRLYYLERACQVQLYAMWTGKRLKRVSDAVVDKTLTQYKTGNVYGGKPGSEHHFAALKRMLDRKESDYLD